MQRLREAADVRRPWRYMSIALLVGFAIAVMGALRAEAAVNVSYAAYSDDLQLGSHEISFSVSKVKNATEARLYVYVKKTDGNGTARLSDDLTQTHQYSFTLPGDAFSVSDDLSVMKLTSGPLKAPGGRNYGTIQFTATNLQPVQSAPDPCYPYKSRDATFTGTIKFDSFLAGLPKLNGSSITGTEYRYAYRSPCPNPGPQECYDLAVMNGYESAGSALASRSLYVSKSPTGRNFSVTFREAEADTAPAIVTHQLSGGFPSTAFRQAPTLKTGKFDGGPVKFLEGAVAFLASEPIQTYSDGDCPDFKSRGGNLAGSLKVDFEAGPDYSYGGSSGTQSKYTKT